MCFHHHLVFYLCHSGAQAGAFRDGQCPVLPLEQPWGPCGAAAGWGTAQNPGLGRTGAEMLLVAHPGHAGSTFLVQRAPGEEEFKCQIELFLCLLIKSQLGDHCTRAECGSTSRLRVDICHGDVVALPNHLLLCRKAVLLVLCLV